MTILGIIIMCVTPPAIIALFMSIEAFHDIKDMKSDKNEPRA